MTLPWRSSDSKCVCPMRTPACEVETTTRRSVLHRGSPGTCVCGGEASGDVRLSKLQQRPQAMAGGRVANLGH